MNALKIFWLYSSVCLDAKLALGRINESEYKRVTEDFTKKGKIPNKSWLENTFQEAFKRIRPYASKNFPGEDIWSINVMKNYWLEGKNGGHNQVLRQERKMNTPLDEKAIDYCSVHLGRILDIKDNSYKIIYEDDLSKGKILEIHKKYVLDAKKGDLIRIHRLNAIEKVDSFSHTNNYLN